MKILGHEVPALIGNALIAAEAEAAELRRENGKLHDHWRHRLEASWSREDDCRASTIALGLELAQFAEQRDDLAQAMWDGLGILGFDRDGDPSPAALIGGMGWDGFREVFLRDLREHREAYDQACEELVLQIKGDESR